MVLSIKSEEADQLARELASLTNESITRAVTMALAECLERHRRTPDLARRVALRGIFDRASRIPRLDSRTDDEILGYSDDGTFE